MIAIDEDRTTIHLTRGDKTSSEFNKLAFCFPIYNEGTGEIENYKFKTTDKIDFIVKEKKGYTKKDVLRKTFTIGSLGYTQPVECPELVLTAQDTKVFDLLNKKKTYWYDLVLNDATTMLGMDNEGAKKLIVYPEGGEVE